MGEVVMPKTEAVQEHEHLVKVLRKGSRQQRQAEAKDQSAELSQYRKIKNGRKPTRGIARR